MVAGVDADADGDALADLTNAEIARYSRHLILPQVTIVTILQPPQLRLKTPSPASGRRLGLG